MVYAMCPWIDPRLVKATSPRILCATCIVRKPMSWLRIQYRPIGQLSPVCLQFLSGLRVDSPCTCAL